MLTCYYMRKHLFSLVNNSITGPDGYGSAGFPGPVGDKGEAGEPSRVEGSQGPPGQKGDRGVPGLYTGEWDPLILCSTFGCYRCHEVQYSVDGCIGELQKQCPTWGKSQFVVTASAYPDLTQKQCTAQCRTW